VKSLFIFQKIESNYGFYTIINEILFVFSLFVFLHYRIFLFISILRSKNLFILSHLEKKNSFLLSFFFFHRQIVFRNVTLMFVHVFFCYQHVIHLSFFQIFLIFCVIDYSLD